MIKMTPLSYKRVENSIRVIEEALSKATARLDDAASQGDLSENSEYDIAKADVASLSQRKMLLEQRLDNAEVAETSSDIIEEGRLILVQDLDNANSSARMMFFDSIGNPVLNGVLNSDSLLGQTIRGQAPGKFTFTGTEGIRNYMVTLLPDSRLEEFEAMYPVDESKMMETLFAEAHGKIDEKA